MCSDTAWSIPCCVAVSASISGEGPSSAAVAPFWELEDGGTEESGAASTKEDHATLREVCGRGLHIQWKWIKALLESAKYALLAT